MISISGLPKHFFVENPSDPLAPCTTCGEHQEAHPLPSKRLRVALLLTQDEQKEQE